MPAAPPREGTPRTNGSDVITAVDASVLRELNQELLTGPEHFNVHPKLERQPARRFATIDEGGIDWGQAEGLAFASLLVEDRSV